MIEMRGVGAVDHVIGWAVAGRLIDALDRLGERVACGQAAVGLDREGNHARHVRRLRRKRDALRLADIGHGEGRDEIGAGVAEQADLKAMIVRGLIRAHQRAGIVSVAARPDGAADHHGRSSCLVTLAKSCIKSMAARLRRASASRP